jgi:very-short-patch-repair endonuclease
VARLATVQGGAVGRAQALWLGLAPGVIRFRCRRERWFGLHRGVYAVGHEALTRRGRAIAALLAAPAGAVLSHRTAAVIWGLLEDDLARPDVTVAHSSSRSRSTLAVHGTQHLPRPDRRTHLHLPITSPLRTLIDLAEVTANATLGTATREARVRGLVTDAQLRRSTTTHFGRHGIARLLAVMEAPEGLPTRSGAERELLRLIAAAGLPRPEASYAIGPYTVDFAWRRERLVVELDDFNTHGDARSFERDRRRDADLQRTGWRVQRITRLQVRDDQLRTIATIAALLAAQ